MYKCGSDTPTPQSDFPDPTIEVYSLFVQDEIRWNQWTFLPGLRYDHTRLSPELTDEFLATVSSSDVTDYNDDDRTWHRVSPKLGVTYQFDDRYTWFGQYAEGFRTSTAKALYGRFENLAGGYTVEPNPDLEPEKSRGLETGLRGYFDAAINVLADFGGVCARDRAGAADVNVETSPSATRNPSVNSRSRGNSSTGATPRSAGSTR